MALHLIGADTEVDARVGERLTLRLPENATTGYQWSLADADGLRAVEDRLAAESTAVPGAAGAHDFDLQADRTGTHTLVFHLRRPWEAEASQERRVVVQVDRG